MRLRSGPSVAAAALVLVLASCTTVVPPSASPMSRAEAATASPASTSAVSATIPPTERQLSDSFWSRVITYAPMAFEFHSLEDIVAGSDLIVRGRIERITTAPCAAAPSPNPARPDVCEEAAASFAIVAIDAVLKRYSRSSSPTVLVGLGHPDITAAEVPGGEDVFFLKNYGTFYSDEGYPTPSDSARWQWYFLANTYQGALRNLDGFVDVPEAPDGWWDSNGPFPSDVDGQPFEQVVDRIRDLVDA